MRKNFMQISAILGSVAVSLVPIAAGPVIFMEILVLRFLNFRFQ